jgi:DeoR family transcriptional regulator, aga operon transcriptional repressor
VAADSSKAGRRAIARICATEKVVLLVTDAGIDTSQSARLAAAGVQVVLA